MFRKISILVLCGVFCASVGALVAYRYIKSSTSQAIVSPPSSTTFVNWMNIVKSNEMLNPNMEGTPFVWKGKLMYYISERGAKSEALQSSVYDFNTREKIATFAQNNGFALGSAFVEGDTFYAFVTKMAGENGKSEIYMVQSNDLKLFSQPLSIYHAPEKQAIFNTSVTKNTDSGDYIMAIETSTKGELSPFTIYFLKSNDLVHWSLITNTVFAKDSYVASPTIKYIDNYYYLWFLMKELNDPNCTSCQTYVTKIARSKDLETWETSPHYFMIPDRTDEGINTSDVDLTEFDNNVYILYAVGDQAKWTNMRYAVYSGTLSQLVNNYFPQEFSTSGNNK